MPRAANLQEGRRSKVNQSLIHKENSSGCVGAASTSPLTLSPQSFRASLVPGSFGGGMKEDHCRGFPKRGLVSLLTSRRPVSTRDLRIQGVQFWHSWPSKQWEEKKDNRGCGLAEGSQQFPRPFLQLPRPLPALAPASISRQLEVKTEESVEQGLKEGETKERGGWGEIPCKQTNKQKSRHTCPPGRFAPPPSLPFCPYKETEKVLILAECKTGSVACRARLRSGKIQPI